MVQLTILADGNWPTIKLSLEDWETETIIEYDKQMTVQFQPNAQCDEEAMEQWVGSHNM